jgi:hypothetical protein
MEGAALFFGGLVLGELFFFVMYFFADGEVKSVRQKLWEDNPNIYTRDGKQASTLFDRFFPHPFLGYVNHNNPPAGRGFATKGLLKANSAGFLGPEFPRERPDGIYTIMLTGGSVAERFSQSYQTPEGEIPPLLEEVLNERYAPPPGFRRFRVLCAAVGGWKQPQQLIMLGLHAHQAHAFVSMEGYNETMASLIGVRDKGLTFEYPWLNLLQDDRSPERKFYYRLIRRTYEGMLVDGLLSRSRLAYGLSTLLRSWLLNRAQRAETGRQDSPTTLETLFSRAEGDADPLEEARERYAFHLQSMQKIAEGHGVRLAVFMQPCAGLGKELTEFEGQRIIRHGYEPVYRQMEETVLSQPNMNTGSLVEAFADVKESVFLDDAHFNPPSLEEYGRGLGHAVIAGHMADALAEWWGLETHEAEET